MSLSFEEVQRFLHQVEFEVGEHILSDFWDYLNEQEFVKEHNAFYPKGIFTEKGVSSYYFFTEKGIVEVLFLDEPVITFWKYEQLSNYRLKFLNRYDLELEINLKDETSIILNSEKDTNTHRHSTMRKKIGNILAVLNELKL